MKNTFDVIIIGAGAAGCYLSSLLAKQGKTVLIIEKSKKIKKDSGIVSKNIENFVQMKKGLVKSRIKKMKFVSPFNKSFIISSEEPFAYLLERDRFGKHMRTLAKTSGARILYAECSCIDWGKGFVEATAGGNKYYAKIVVGCDGVSSLVRKSMAIRSPGLFHGAMSLGNFSVKQSDIEVHFNKFFSPHFFAWSIPQTKETGVISKKDPLEYMKYYQRKVNFIPKKTFISPITIGTVKSFGERSLLVGDSCGQVKPVSGGGIMYSLICANHAAAAINAAFDANDFSERFLKRYEKAWKADLGNDIRFQLFCRRLFRKMNNRDIDDFFSIAGKDMENIKCFDYDKMSTVLWELPRITILKCALRYISLIFEWSHD